MILDSTTKSIDVLMGEVITTSNPDYVVAYDDITTTTFIPKSSDGALNGTSVVSIVSAPSASTQRHVKYISINNTDTVSHTITIRLNNNSTNRVLYKATLAINEVLQYTEGLGFECYQKDGNIKVSTSLPGVIQSFLRPVSYVYGSISGSASFPTDNTVAYFMGIATKSSSSVNVIISCVTTAMSGTTYSEVGIGVYKGPMQSSQMIANNVAEMKVLGYTDTSSVFNSTGIKNISVSLSPSIQPGDAIFLLQAHQATTTPTLRTTTTAYSTQLTSNVMHTQAGARISTTSPLRLGTITGNNPLIITAIYLN